MPENPDGTGILVVRLQFSEDVAVSHKVLREQAISINSGTIKSAKRVDEQKGLWQITITPTQGDVTLTIGPSPADCTAEGVALTGTATATVTYSAP